MSSQAQEPSEVDPDAFEPTEPSASAPSGEDETDDSNVAETADPTSAPSDGKTGPRPDLPHGGR